MNPNGGFIPVDLDPTGQLDATFDYDAYLQVEQSPFANSLGQPMMAQGVMMDSSSSDSIRFTPPGSDGLYTGIPQGPEQARSSSSSQQRSRQVRKGHHKSRGGCYNCKRRRIKCQENRPACGHCVKTGLKCEYPSLQQINHQPHNTIPLFSLQDMRFFQHFLTQCFPHQPLKQEEIWTHEIPCIAHNHEFLMHAILGYAASELIPKDPAYAAASMNHRIKAIRAIKKRLGEAALREVSFEEANAMVATCYALTFQSVSLDDGLAEYMTFIRGIVIVSMQMMFRGIKPIFSNMTDSESDAILAPLMENLPLIQKGWADAARDAIAGLQPLCTEEVEKAYHQKLVTIVDMLYINSFAAYKANSAQYGWWMMLPHAQFQHLLDQSNQVILLLHSHWIALSQIMAFISQQEFESRAKVPTETQPSDPGFIRWLKYLNARVDYEYQHYNQWPVWVDAQLDMDTTFFGRTQ